MLENFLEIMTELNPISIVARLCLAVLCGGIIGVERGKKGRPAGFRTHILVCLGSALAMMTNEYLMECYGTGDPARLGAQVISGIGFLGAGTIIVTGRQQVKGLTTAAGLWASACMGLAIGVGFYEASIIACFFIWLVSSALHRLDNYILSRSKVMDMYVEFRETSDISAFIDRIRVHGIRVVSIEMTAPNTRSGEGVAAVMTLRMDQKRDHADLLALISEIQGVKFVEGI